MRGESMKTVCALLASMFFAGAVFCSPSRAEGYQSPERYNVVWEIPGKDYNGSMPAGNGDITLNAWVEESGDLLFYIAKTDAWDDYGRLVKIGRVRIALQPRPAVPLAAFRQTLNLVDGTILVSAGTGAGALKMRIWVDANHPQVHVEVTSQSPTQAMATIELWRTNRHVLPSVEVSDVLKGRPKDGTALDSIWVEPDSLLLPRAGSIGWFHHNVKSIGPDLLATVQGLRGFERPDPILHRTFGAIVTSEGASPIDATHLQTQRTNRHHFVITVLTKVRSLPREWRAAADSVIAGCSRVPFDARRKMHEKWWEEFWSRSWINAVSAVGGDTSRSDDAYVVSRAYALQRFINACAGRGAFPIKFNGSLFTVPYPGRPGDADYRQWGPGYWWQNTRLPYISMCSSGDFDLMKPLFQMYGKDLLPLFRYRTRLYMNHGGAYIPECIMFWGDVFSETYGWTPYEKRTDKLQESRWHKWEWVSGLELVWMMLDYFDYTLDEEFLREMALPTAHEILTFFDQHYETDARGKLVMHPSQSLETWWDCTNPMPEIAGLHAALSRLLLLPDTVTTSDQRAYWHSVNRKLPDIPTRTIEGRSALAPADSFARKQNIENPELYAVFPFRLVAFNTPNRDLGIEAFRRREDSGNFGWRQDDIFAAYLGLVDTARAYIAGRARNKNAGSAFPAFWGPNYDWIPDQDHGGVLLKTLQSMLMQTDGRIIYLNPAWPKDWNVEFRLRAPYNTTIEGRFANGEFKDLKVSPESRSKDVVFTTR
jgi:alpha-L-fucosidase 2